MSELQSGALARQSTSIFAPISAVLYSCRAQWIFFTVPLLFLVSNEYFFWGQEGLQRVSLFSVASSLASLTLPVALFILFVVRMVQFACIIKPESPLKALVEDVKRLARSPRQICNGLPVLAVLILFNKAMLDLKPNIPRIVPFGWDETLMQLDRVLHFGIDPWQLLQPVLGFVWITFAFNLAYNFWFVALFGLSFWFAFQPGLDTLRTRFFLSYMIAWWIGGGILALVFSSAGPCYYGLIGLAPDPYAPLMAYLKNVNDYIPLWALDAQKLLWNGYTGQVLPAIGISAFPSMHNAMATIFALAAWRLHRGLGLILSANIAVILIGSVHLGWHYAVDAYVGILVALFAWWLTGPIAQWFHSLQTSLDYRRYLSP